MKVVVIGATGFVGQQIVNELDTRNYNIKALARDITKVKDSTNIEKVAVDIFKHEDLIAAITGADAVVSAYNPGWTNPNIYEDFLAWAQAIQKAIKEAGIKRYIVIGGAGSLLIDGTRLVDGPDFPAEIKPGALAAAEYLDIIRKEDELDWTYFSPAIEMHPGTSGERKGTYRTALDSPVFDANGRSVLSVEDVAVAIVDELENNNFIKKRFTAAY